MTFRTPLTAFSLSKWASTFRPGRLVSASCMIGIAGLFRWDFGISGLLAIAGATTFAVVQEKRSTDRCIPVSSALFAAVAPALTILLAIYVPLLVIFSSPVRWYQEVPLFSLTEFAKWRNVELLGPAYFNLVRSTTVIGFNASMLTMVYAATPLVLVIGAMSTAAHAFFCRSVELSEKKVLVLMAYLGLLCLLLFNQMKVRSGIVQGFPALVASLPLIALLLQYHLAAIVRRNALIAILTVATLVPAVMLSIAGIYGLLEALDTRRVEFNTPRALGLRVMPEKGDYEKLVAYIRENTSSDEPIFSGAQDHSQLFVNDALLYFLTDRPPADRFLELDLDGRVLMRF